MKSYLFKYLRIIHKSYSIYYGKLSYLLFNIISLAPSKLHILITTKCNLTCDFCYAADGLNKETGSQLTIDEWEKIAQNIPKSTAVIFTGGEPFVHNSFYNVLDLMFKNKNMVSVTTNGTNIDVEKLLTLKPHRMFVLMFSLHGPEEIHDKTTGKIGSYQKIIQTISRIDKYKKDRGLTYPILSLKLVINSANTESLIDFIKFIDRSIPVDHLYFNLMADTTLHHSLELYTDVNYPKLFEKNIFEYAPKDKLLIKDIIRFIKQNKKTFRIDVGFNDDFESTNDLIQYIDNRKNYLVKSCRRPWHELLIYGNGDYGNCLGLVADNIRNHNYKIKGLMKVDRYEAFLKLFKKHNSALPACYGCKEASYISKEKNNH